MVLAAAAGCGRFGFDSVAPPPDAAASTDSGPGDAAVVDAALAGPTPIHRYPLVGTNRDELGGPAVIDLGGAFEPGGYRFPAGAGLAITNALPRAIYTLDLEVGFDEVTGYRKLVDFKSLTTDEGVYVFDGALQLVLDLSGTVVVTSAKRFTAGKAAWVTITRDAAGRVTAYINGADPISFVDTAGVAEFSVGGTVGYVAMDDIPTNQTENSGGTLRAISIWDRSLTAAQVAALR